MVPATLLLLALLAIGGDCRRRRAIHQCLEFDVLCTADDFEVRRYNESVWVGTQVNGNNHQAFSAARRALRMYTRGSNVEEVWIRRTGQLLVSVAANGERNLFMLLPTEVQNNPPTPTDLQVFIQRFLSMEVFVREIGFGNTELEGSDFNQTLTDEGAQFNDTTFFVAICRRGRHGRRGPRVKRSSSMSASEDASDASGDSNSDEEDRRRRSAVEGLDVVLREERGRYGRAGPRVKRSSSMSASEDASDASGDSNSDEEDRRRRSAVEGFDVVLREERSGSDDASDASGDSDSDEEDRRRRSAAEELDFMSGIDTRRWRSAGHWRPRREIWFIATGSSNCPIP